MSSNLHKYFRILAKVTPAKLKSILQRNIDTLEYFQSAWAQDDPFSDESEIWDCPNSCVRVGIIREFSHRHSFYIAACREMGLSYILLDLSHVNWVEHFNNAACDFYVVWPSPFLGIWKEMFDERLWILQFVMNKKVYPTFTETYLYENKRRVHDWLDVHKIPHPETWVFFERKVALQFAFQVPLPIVVKSTRGACASGVQICRDRKELIKITRKYFSSGFVPERGYKWDAQRLCIIFQEYLADVEEWRMIRIGDSYFGYRKEMAGDFHSGSHGWSWIDPDPKLLGILYNVTEIGKFTSMNVDIFKTTDGRLLVNELQTQFGATNPAEKLVINGCAGRYLLRDGNWVFEEGEFCQNHLTNLRLKHILTLIKANKCL
ncbi:hypothetical protein K8T06_16420 [bacterium]|nr:hypothetical protein [bacterium]